MISQNQSVNQITFLSGGGEMGDRIRAYDWSSTSLGHPDEWPQSLRTTLSIILNSSFPMFLMWGQDLISFYNDAFRPSLGNNGKHPSALGKKGEEVWAEIWDIISPMLFKVLNHGESVYHEDLHVPFYRNGQIEDTYWTFSYSPVSDETKKPSGVFVTCTETTENIFNRRKLEEHKDQLHFAIEATELGTWDYNPATNKLSGNERLKKWFGIPEEGEIDLSFAIERIDEQDRTHVINSIEQALRFESGGKYDCIYTINNPETKRHRIVRAMGRAWFNEDKIAVRFNGTLQDITNQTEVKTALEESERRWKMLTNLVPSYTFTITADGRVDYVSEKWHEFTGVKLSEDLHQDFFSIFHPDDLKISQRKWDFAIRKKLALEEEIRWRRFDGKFRWMVYRIEPIELIRGKIDSWFGSAMDITEIKNTEQALHASEKSFENLVRKVPTGITVFSGANFVVEMANEAYLRLIDKKENEFVGKPLFETLPETKDFIEKHLTMVLQTGEPYYGYEFPVVIHRYGKQEKTYFNFIYQPVRMKNEVTGIVVVAHEVTGLVKAKHAIAESEKQFRNMVMQSPVAMAIFSGEDLIIEMANLTMLKKIWRKKSHEVIGNKLVDVFPELKTQKYPTLLTDVIKTGKDYREYESIAHVQGEDGLKTFYLDFDYKPLYGTEGTVTGVMVSVYDVTEKVETRKKIEEVANELEIFKFVSDNVSDFVGISDLAGNPIYVNKSGLQKVGLNRIENVHLSDFFFEEDRDFIENEFLKKVIDEGTADTEIRFRHFGNQSPIWMLYNVVLVKDTNGNPFGFATSSKDISARKEWMTELEKKVEERTVALREANLKLARSNEDLQQFAHVASHDLKEPVRKIKLFSSRLQDDFGSILGNKGNTFLTKILDSTQRMYAMINGVLNYSSIAALDQPYSYVDLNTVIAQIENDLEVLIEEKQGRIIYHALPEIHGLTELIYQLFYNLINNSLKFSKVDVPSVITIESSWIDIHDKRFHQITLRDNGIGFDNSFAENIFGTFTRLNSKEKYEGTGLGLSLCKKIVERHGGHISAHGERNVGAEFSMIFPISSPLSNTDTSE